MPCMKIENTARHQSHNTCYVPVLQIIPKGILACSVRNLEGTDAKISYNEHLLSQSGKSEGKDTSWSSPTTRMTRKDRTMLANA